MDANVINIQLQFWLTCWEELIWKRIRCHWVQSRRDLWATEGREEFLVRSISETLSLFLYPIRQNFK